MLLVTLCALPVVLCGLVLLEERSRGLMCAGVDGATFAIKLSPGLSFNVAASCVMIDCKAVGWPLICEYLVSWAELCRS